MNPEEINLDYLKECYYYCTSPITFEKYVDQVSEYIAYHIQKLMNYSLNEQQRLLVKRLGYVFDGSKVNREALLSIQRVTVEEIAERLLQCGFTDEETAMVLNAVREQAWRNTLHHSSDSQARKTFEVLEFNGAPPVKLNWTRGMFCAYAMQ